MKNISCQQRRNRHIVMKTAQKMGIKRSQCTLQLIEMHLMLNLLMKLLIGESPSNQSYLLGDKIIEANRWSGCYSSRYGFWVKTLILRKQNKTTSFYWPKSKAIHIMGSVTAKEAVKAYNIPWFLRRSHYRYWKAKVVAREIGFLFWLRPCWRRWKRNA
jgi:propionyl-CoA carboxylase alpha chain